MLFAPVGDEYACLVLEEAAEALLEDVIANLRIDLREKKQDEQQFKASKEQRKARTAKNRESVYSLISCGPLVHIMETDTTEAEEKE